MVRRSQTLSVIPLLSAIIGITSPGDAALYVEKVIGPGDTVLLPTPMPTAASPPLTFDQMADKALSGQIMNSDKRFKPSQLPATFVARFSDRSFCTATLIGPRVLLTAAHCIDLKRKGSGGKWETASGGIRLSKELAVRPFISCEMAPAYTASKPKLVKAPRNAHDYALCELASFVPLKAETIDTIKKVASDELLLLAGYGCAENDLVGGEIPTGPTAGNVLRAGLNHPLRQRTGGWMTLIGRLGTSGAIICPGDSGGSAYAGVTLDEQAYAKGWRVVAINSAVGPASAQQMPRTQPVGGQQRVGRVYASYLSPLSDREFTDFLTSFMKPDIASRAICGINRWAPITECRP